MAYAIVFDPATKPELADLPRSVRRHIRRAIEILAATPRPADSLPMRGAWEGFDRIPVGEYRVIYRVEDRLERVRIVRVGHRSAVYEDPLSPYA